MRAVLGGGWCWHREEGQKARGEEGAGRRVNGRTGGRCLYDGTASSDTTREIIDALLQTMTTRHDYAVRDDVYMSRCAMNSKVWQTWPM